MYSKISDLLDEDGDFIEEKKEIELKEQQQIRKATTVSKFKAFGANVLLEGKDKQIFREIQHIYKNVFWHLNWIFFVHLPLLCFVLFWFIAFVCADLNFIHNVFIPKQNTAGRFFANFLPFVFYVLIEYSLVVIHVYLSFLQYRLVFDKELQVLLVYWKLFPFTKLRVKRFPLSSMVKVEQCKHRNSCCEVGSMCCGIGFGFWNCQSKFYGYALNYKSSGIVITMRDLKKEVKYYRAQRAKQQIQGGDMEESLIKKEDSASEEEEEEPVQVQQRTSRKLTVFDKIRKKTSGPKRMSSDVSQFSLLDDEDVILMTDALEEDSSEEEEELEQVRQMKQRMVEENTNKQIKNREAQSWSEMFTNTFVSQFFVATNHAELLLHQIQQVKEEMDKF